MIDLHNWILYRYEKIYAMYIKKGVEVWIIDKPFFKINIPPFNLKFSIKDLEFTFVKGEIFSINKSPNKYVISLENFLLLSTNHGEDISGIIFIDDKKFDENIFNLFLEFCLETTEINNYTVNDMILSDKTKNKLNSFFKACSS
jgi:hypothetical protein